MHYLGGKHIISKDISNIINEFSKDKPFVSLFLGAGSVESKVIAKEKIFNDKHKYLISMWKDLQKGREFPSTITYEDYIHVRDNKDADEGLAGFVGFGCSFGGKWFGGYARSNENPPRNYADVAKRGLDKKFATMKTATFTNLDYRDVIIPEGAVIYCDSPYAGTTDYKGVKFDYTTYWEYISELSANHLVFISEQQAPDDFISIWNKKKKRFLDLNKDNIFEKTEHLFIHKNWLHLFNSEVK